MAGAGIQNTINFSQGEKLSQSTATDISNMQEASTDVSRVNHTGDPNGAVSANPSSLCHDPVSGNVYFKQTGTGNTGWVQIGTVLNDYHDSRYIVSAGGSADGANYTTIASAITAAVSAGGTQNVAIQPGTYTENFSLPADINLVTYAGMRVPAVTINGKITCSDAGNRTISGIRLQTNSDYSLVISGSAATNVILQNCDIHCTNNTGINLTSSGGSKLYFFNCQGDLTTTGIAYIAKTGNGSFSFYGGNFENSGVSVTANSVTDGSFFMYGVNFHSIFDLGVNSDGFNIYDSVFDCGDLNATVITQASNGSVPQGTCFNCFISSGTAPTIALTASSMRLINSTLTTGNTNAITETGASTLVMGGLNFGGSGTGINVTTVNQIVEGTSRTIGGTNSGKTNTLTVQNLSNTASSGANVISSVGGSSAADATHQAIVSGVTTWTWGCDNSDSDAWVLAASSALGTTNVMRVATTGEITYPLQSAFSAVLGTNSTDVTGDGTNYNFGGSGAALTEIYDRNSDFSPGDGAGTACLYTAPVTGIVNLQASVLFQQVITAMTCTIQIITSNRNYVYGNTGTSFTGNQPLACSALADMDAADTATVRATVSGGTKVVDVYGPSATDFRTYFQGWLLG